jgi:hypothetical protein
MEKTSVFPPSSLNGTLFFPGMYIKIENTKKKRTNLEYKDLIENGVQGFPVNFRFHLFLFVRQQVELHVWVRSAGHIHSREIFRLDHCDCQLKIV